MEAAYGRLRGHVVRTPLVAAPSTIGVPEDTLYLKLENFQRTGAFKLRGAINRLASLSAAEARRGVVAASAGNHAQGVAWAARARGVPATIVMPRGASPLKVRGTELLGARVLLHGTDYEDAHEEALRLARAEGLTYIHPFDDAAVIVGQGTVGLEIFEDLPATRRIVAGVGGGGLLAGLALSSEGRTPRVEIVGVQPTGADTLTRSLAEHRIVQGGRPSTFADGLATRHIGELAFRILERARARAFAVDDRSIARASFLLLEHAKVLAEGAGAAALAAVLAHPELLREGPTVIVVSGGNIDPFVLDRVLWIGLTADGRLVRLRAGLRDSPGRLAEFLSIAAGAAANVRQIVHDRESPDRSPDEISIEIELEVRDAEHGREVVRAYREKGWPVEVVPLLSERAD